MSNSNENFKRLDETCIQIDGQNYYRFCSQPVTIEHDSQMMRVGTACVLPVGHEGKTHVDYYGVWKVDEEAFDFNEVAYTPLKEINPDYPEGPLLRSIDESIPLHPDRVNRLRKAAGLPLVTTDGEEIYADEYEEVEFPSKEYRHHIADQLSDYYARRFRSQPIHVAPTNSGYHVEVGAGLYKYDLTDNEAQTRISEHWHSLDKAEEASPAASDEQKDKRSDPRIDFTDIKVEDFFNRLDKFLYERDKRKKTEQYDNWLKTWREASSKPSFVVDADIKPINYCSGKPEIYTVEEKRSPWWKRIFGR